MRSAVMNSEWATENLLLLFMGWKKKKTIYPSALSLYVGVVGTYFFVLTKNKNGKWNRVLPLLDTHIEYIVPHSICNQSDMVCTNTNNH